MAPNPQNQNDPEVENEVLPVMYLWSKNNARYTPEQAEKIREIAPDLQEVKPYVESSGKVRYFTDEQYAKLSAANIDIKPYQKPTDPQTQNSDRARVASAEMWSKNRQMGEVKVDPNFVPKFYGETNLQSDLDRLRNRPVIDRVSTSGVNYTDIEYGAIEKRVNTQRALQNGWFTYEYNDDPAMLRQRNAFYTAKIAEGRITDPEAAEQLVRLNDEIERLKVQYAFAQKTNRPQTAESILNQLRPLAQKKAQIEKTKTKSWEDSIEAIERRSAPYFLDGTQNDLAVQIMDLNQEFKRMVSMDPAVPSEEKSKLEKSIKEKEMALGKSFDQYFASTDKALAEAERMIESYNSGIAAATESYNNALASGNTEKANMYKGQIESLNKERRQYEAVKRNREKEKELFFLMRKDPEAAAAQTLEELGYTGEGVPGKTAQERARNLYAITVMQIEDAMNDRMFTGREFMKPEMATANPLSIMSNVMDALSTSKYIGDISMTGRVAKNDKALAELLATARALAPLALINQAPAQRDTDTGWSVFGKEFLSAQFPVSGQKTNRMTAESVVNTVNMLGLSEEQYNQGQFQSIQGVASPYKHFSAKDWASNMATTADIMFDIAISEAVTMGVPASLIKSSRALAQASRVPKDMSKLSAWNRIRTKVGTGFSNKVWGGIEEGVRFEVAGEISGQEDELNFWAGFGGGAAAASIQGLMKNETIKRIGYQRLSGLFGNKTPEAVDAIKRLGTNLRIATETAGRGPAELVQEFGEEIGNIYKDSETWQDFKGLFEERFGNMSDNMHFAVMTMVMGIGMGVGTTIGDYAYARNKEYYSKLTDDEKVQFAEFLKEIDAEWEIAFEKPEEAAESAPTSAQQAASPQAEESVLASVENTASAISVIKPTISEDEFDRIYNLMPSLQDDISDFVDEAMRLGGGSDAVSYRVAKEYHKAKADGSNPQLVEAVESLLTTKAEPIQEEVAQAEPVAPVGIEVSDNQTIVEFTEDDMPLGIEAVPAVNQEQVGDKTRMVFNNEDLEAAGIDPDELSAWSPVSQTELASVDSSKNDAATQAEPEEASQEDGIDRLVTLAREGDLEAQKKLDEYGLQWDKEEVVRFVGQSEVDALLGNERIEGKNKDYGVDVTKDVTGKNVPATNTEYRVRFKEDGFDDKKSNSRVKMKNSQDGWVQGGYDINDVDVIEKKNSDGTWSVVYQSKGKDAAVSTPPTPVSTPPAPVSAPPKKSEAIADEQERMARLLEIAQGDMPLEQKRKEEARINDEYDALYLDAVDSGQITPEEAIEQLEAAGSIFGDAYKSLKAMVEKPVEANQELPRLTKEERVIDRVTGGAVTENQDGTVTSEFMGSQITVSESADEVRITSMRPAKYIDVSMPNVVSSAHLENIMRISEEAKNNDRAVVIDLDGVVTPDSKSDLIDILKVAGFTVEDGVATREPGQDFVDVTKLDENVVEKGVRGNAIEGDIKFADGLYVPGEWVVIDASNLIASHDFNGRRNPNHKLSQAQPKERSDAASQLQQMRIASNPRFNEVSAAADAYIGAPIVTADGQVIQGNNRSIGLKRHYAGGKSSYKNQLVEKAAEFGLDPEAVAAMPNPVLVRYVPVSPMKAVELGNYKQEDIETGNTRRLDPVTTLGKMLPKPDAVSRLVSLVFNPDYKTTKESIRANQSEIVKLLTPFLSNAELVTFRNGDNLTNIGVDDVAVLAEQFLFVGNELPIMREVFEYLPYNAQKGLLQALPSIYSEGARQVLPAVQSAMKIAVEFTNGKIDDFAVWSRQAKMGIVAPVELYTPLELKIAEILVTERQKAIAEKFKKLASNTTAVDGGMFADDARPAMPFNEAVADAFGVEITTQDEKEIARSAEASAPAKPDGNAVKEKRETYASREERTLDKVNELSNRIADVQGETVTPVTPVTAFTEPLEVAKRFIEANQDFDIGQFGSFDIDGKKVFYHASFNQREGRLRLSNAPQFGYAVYFSTKKSYIQKEFGDFVTEVALNLENPVYTNTKEWDAVVDLALKKANEGKPIDDDGNIIGLEDDFDEISSSLISESAKELGHDAIIDRGSNQYENEVAVLDESKIVYKEDVSGQLNSNDLVVKARKQAIDAFRSSEWYQGLAKGQKSMATKRFNSMLDEAIGGESTLDKWIEAIDEKIKELKKFGKGTLGMNLAVVVAEKTLEAIKLALQAGKSAQEAIEAGLEVLRSSRWYKTTTKENQEEVEQALKDYIDGKAKADNPWVASRQPSGKTPQPAQPITATSGKSKKTGGSIPEQFLERAIGKPNQRSQRKGVKKEVFYARGNGATVDVSLNADGSLQVENIQVTASKRRQGRALDALSKLVDASKKSGVPLKARLTSGDGISISDVKAMLQKAGFEVSRSNAMEMVYDPNPPILTMTKAEAAAEVRQTILDKINSGASLADIQSDIDNNPDWADKSGLSNAQMNEYAKNVINDKKKFGNDTVQAKRKMRKHRLVRRFEEVQPITDAEREAFELHGDRYYEVIKNADIEAIAVDVFKDVMAENGNDVQKAYKEYMATWAMFTLDEGISMKASLPVHVRVLHKFVTEARRQGDHVLMSEVVSKLADLSELLGRGLQHFREEAGPDSFVNLTLSQQEEYIREAIGEDNEAMQALIDEIQAIRDELFGQQSETNRMLEELAKRDERIAELMKQLDEKQQEQNEKTVADNKERTRRLNDSKKQKNITKKEAKVISEALKQHASDLRFGLATESASVSDNTIAGALDAAADKLLESESTLLAMDEALAVLKASDEYKNATPEMKREMVKDVQKILFRMIQGLEEASRKLTKDYLRANRKQIDWKKIIHEYINANEESRDRIIKQMIDDLGVTDRDLIDQLTEALKDRMKEQIKDRVKKRLKSALEKLSKLNNKQRNGKLNDIIDAVALGALSDAQIRDMFADVYRFKGITPEMVKQLESLVALLFRFRAAKNDAAAQVVIDQIRNFIRDNTDYKRAWGAIIKEFMLYNVLSGIRTQMNAFAGAMTELIPGLVGQTFRYGTKNPVSPLFAAYQMMRSGVWSRALKSSAAAALANQNDVQQYGFYINPTSSLGDVNQNYLGDVIMNGLQKSKPFYIQMLSFVMQPFRMLHLLGAQDAFLNLTAKEFLEYMAAYESIAGESKKSWIARMNPKFIGDIQKMVRETMDPDKTSPGWREYVDRIYNEDMAAFKLAGVKPPMNYKARLEQSLIEQDRESAGLGSKRDVIKEYMMMNTPYGIGSPVYNFFTDITTVRQNDPAYVQVGKTLMSMIFLLPRITINSVSRVFFGLPAIGLLNSFVRFRMGKYEVIENGRIVTKAMTPKEATEMLHADVAQHLVYMAIAAGIFGAMFTLVDDDDEEDEDAYGEVRDKYGDPKRGMRVFGKRLVLDPDRLIDITGELGGYQFDARTSERGAQPLTIRVRASKDDEFKTLTKVQYAPSLGALLHMFATWRDELTFMPAEDQSEISVMDPLTHAMMIAGEMSFAETFRDIKAITFAGEGETANKIAERIAKKHTLLTQPRIYRDVTQSLLSMTENQQQRAIDPNKFLKPYESYFMAQWMFDTVEKVDVFGNPMNYENHMANLPLANLFVDDFWEKHTKGKPEYDLFYKHPGIMAPVINRPMFNQMPLIKEGEYTDAEKDVMVIGARKIFGAIIRNPETYESLNQATTEELDMSITMIRQAAVRAAMMLTLGEIHKNRNGAEMRSYDLMNISTLDELRENIQKSKVGLSQEALQNIDRAVVAGSVVDDE